MPSPALLCTLFHTSTALSTLSESGCNMAEERWVALAVITMVPIRLWFLSC